MEFTSEVYGVTARLLIAGPRLMRGLVVMVRVIVRVMVMFRVTILMRELEGLLCSPENGGPDFVYGPIVDAGEDEARV